VELQQCITCVNTEHKADSDVQCKDRASISKTVIYKPTEYQARILLTVIECGINASFILDSLITDIFYTIFFPLNALPSNIPIKNNR
jgi:hypothetical protein